MPSRALGCNGPLHSCMPRQYIMRVSRGWVVEFPRMRDRAWILAACVLVIAAILLLAPAMINLRFEPARPHYRASDTAILPVFSDPYIDESISVWQILAFWLALVVRVVLTLLLLPPELRKRSEERRVGKECR